METWDERWEVGRLPDHLSKRDVSMAEISELKYLGMKLGRKFGMVIVIVFIENIIVDIIKTD